ncbi:hypothetical protein FPOAC2_10194 [Fusarium poae]
MIQDLLDETCLELHVSCIIGGFQSADAMKSPHGPSTIPCSLEISVYGPLSIFEELGAWFEHYQVYLQDPRECHREVRYCNPTDSQQTTFPLAPSCLTLFLRAQVL